MPTLQQWGARIAAAALPQGRLVFGPWAGSMRSVPADRVPPEYIAGGTNFLYVPRFGAWKRRGGQTQKFDAGSAGLLPAKWSSKCRDLQEFPGSLMTDAVPSLAALLTKETVTGLDSGKFSNIWIRDQVRDANYTVGQEYNATTYPPPVAVATYKYAPLWYDSGDGGMTRGISEFQRRLFFGGSRRLLKVGNWWYVPNLYGTPCRFQATPESADGIALNTLADDIGAFTVQSSPCWQRWKISDSQDGGLVWSGSCTVASKVITIAAGGCTANVKVGDLITGTGTTQPIYVASVDSDTQVTASGEGIYGGITDTGTPRTHKFYRGARMVTTDQSPADTGFVYLNNETSFSAISCTMPCVPLSSSYTRWRISVTLKLTTHTGEGAKSLYFHVTLSDGNKYLTSSLASTAMTSGAYAVYTFDIDTSTLSPSGTGTPNKIQMFFGGTAGTFAPGLYVAYLTMTPLAASSAGATRMIPSGPLPPTHAGTLTAAEPISSNLGKFVPASDVTDGDWVDQAAGTNLYLAVDAYDTTDATYIKNTGLGGLDLCELQLPTVTPTPVVDDEVKIHVRAKAQALTDPLLFRADLQCGATFIAQLKVSAAAYTHGAAFVDYYYTLTSAEILTITNWADLRIRIDSDSPTEMRVSFAALEVVGEATATAGGWSGADRYYHSVAYRFEDDSIWAPCIPRGKNVTLPNGYGLFTVAEGNAKSNWGKVTWTHIPIGPYGTKSRILLRTPKIDYTTSSNLQLDPTDLRVVWEIQDNTTTTYDDFFADDDSLTLDVDGLLIRDDLIMPPRARYLFGGDARVCHAFGGLNPTAIILAPVGYATDWDLNVNDVSSTAFAAKMYYNLTATSLVLYRDDASADSKTITLAGLTLEQLVDTINATLAADDGGQWRAQMAPGANPQALAATHLCPTLRSLTNCTVTPGTGTGTITRASGLSAVPVGAYIGGTGVTVGAYVSAVASDTSLTYVGTISGAGPKTLTFAAATGDAPSTKYENDGYVRAIANSLPAFLYFNNTYLDQFPLEKSAVWMTVASPGAAKSAPNLFSGKTANKFVPPYESGISMGGFAVDNGFVVPFANKTAAIRNTRDSGTGIDEDYHLFILNESRGCCAWNTVAPGNRCGVYFTPEGLIAADLFNELLLTPHTYAHVPTTGHTAAAIGDFTYEAPLCIAATAADDDTAYMTARVMREAIWVNYRSDSGHPDRQVVYDFSAAMDVSGLRALRNGDKLWAWSLPLVREATAMCEARGADGAHLYAWNDGNAGSAGDGRVDEIEDTSNTDNGVAISASLRTPWTSLASSNNLSAQEMTFWHNSPVGSTCQAKFHRSTADDSYSFTPSTSDTLIVSEDPFMLTLPARVTCNACYLEWLQTAGGASELRKMELRAKSLPSYK